MQDALIRQILAEMGRQRMSGKALCKKAGLSEPHWSDMKNLKRAISLDKLCAVGNALGIVFQVPITPQKSPPP